MSRLTYLGLPLSIAAFSLVASTQQVFAQSAHKLYDQGRDAEQRDDVETAYEDYAKAFQKKPTDERYKISYDRLKLDASAAHVKTGERLRDQSDFTGAETEFLRALAIDPSNELANQEIRITREKVDGEAKAPVPETAMAPGERKALLGLGATPELKPTSNEPITIHATDDVKVLYQTIGKLAGINVLFDPDYHSTRLQIDLANVNVYDALRILGTVSGTFWKPVTANTIFVAQNTRGKRTELDEQAVQTFYLTNVSQQNDLNDIQTALRNVFSTGAKLYAVPSQNAIIMRGTPDELLLAGKLINDLDKARPEVVVDVAILEVSRTLERTIGIQLPQTASLSFQSSTAATTASTATTSTSGTAATTTSGLTLNNLAHLNSTDFAVTLGPAAVNLLLSDTSTRILQNPRLRATDGQEATVKIGEKLPVATGSYQAGVATAVTSSLVNTQFQYLDIGVNVDMKPTVHYDRDVSMKLKIDVSSTNGTEDLGGIDEPILTQRVTEEVVRLREGEATILGGFLQHQTATNVSGTPGLSELPILKYVFGSRDKTDSDDEIVFLLIPHVVRASEISPLNLRQIDTGTTNDIQLRHMSADGTDEDVAASQESPTTDGNGKSTTIPDIGSPLPVRAGGSNPAQMSGSIPGQIVPVSALRNAQNGTQSGAMNAAGAAAAALGRMQDEANAAGGAPVSLQLIPSNATQSIGNTFQEQVMLTGGHDVYSSPLQVQYDAKRLQLINVDEGDLLGRDGQAVALVHRDDPINGIATISTSRPPGVAGITGSGTLCTLTFKATAAGDAAMSITRPVIRDSKQQPLPATGSQGVVHIQ
jgi:general secretion pathway protein D